MLLRVGELASAVIRGNSHSVDRDSESARAIRDRNPSRGGSPAALASSLVQPPAFIEQRVNLKALDPDTTSVIGIADSHETSCLSASTT
jgi:hypothetical protein